MEGGMFRQLAALGIRFDIGKVNDPDYGRACWKVLWRAVTPTNMPNTLLFEGDTAATNAGSENVFCIALQSVDLQVLKTVRQVLALHEPFLDVCAFPPLIDNEACTGEPLVSAGKVDHLGRFESRLSGGHVE